MKAYLTEDQALGQIKHLTHLEDVILLGGKRGVYQAEELFRDILDVLKGESKSSISVKIDGSPAVVFGIDPRPSTKGGFFIATKGAFNKMPKMAHDHDEIEEMYGDSPVKEVLHLALRHLEPLVTGGIFQGDFLFYVSAKTMETIDGVRCMTFTPNTITYAIPETDAMFSWVSRAPFGMVVHIEYTDHGSTDNMLNVSPVSLSQAYGLVKRGQQAGLFMLTPTLSGKTVSLSIDTRFIEKELSKLSDLAGRCPSSVPGAATLMRFINDMVRDNTSMLKRVIAAQNGQAFFGMYYDYLNKKQIGSADKSLEPLFDAYVIAASLKMAIVSALNEFGTVIGRNFIKTGDTYKPTNPEGFVLMPSGSGAVKLVDRFEFSRLNFINNALREDVPLTEALALADVNLTVGHKTATIVVGRFTVLTKAHLELMNRAAHLSADMVVVCIVMGEKTSLDTDRNPTSFDMRKEMIDASFSLPHRTVKVTSSFIGELVSVCRDADVEPKYIVIGPDRREEMTKQVDTFKKDLKLTIQVKGQDTVLGPQYRASNVRAAIRNDDVETFKKLTPVGEWKLWSKLRKVV